MKRSHFLKAMTLPVCAGLGLPAMGGLLMPPERHRLKISLNAFSFNDPLRNGKMNLDDLLEFCASSGFDAVDLTGYYFPGYPEPPSEKYLYQIKRHAFRLGLDISGTGIKNDFTDPDKTKRAADIATIKKWIETAAKLGAPVIRIFAGTQSPQGYSWKQVARWMMDDVAGCVEHGKRYGVVVAMQNHNDFIQTGEQAKTLMEMGDPEWFGLVLDIGSYRIGDPYVQIRETAPFAVNWQIKEKMFVNEKEETTDLVKIMDIVKSSGYRGYLPIETLGSGDPKIKVPLFLQQVEQALG